MLRKLWSGIRYYFKHTDVLLMVLSLAICCFGLVLIFSASQNVEKVNTTKVMIVQSAGIVMGLAGMIVLSLCDFSRMPRLWIVMAVFNILFQLSLAVIGKDVGGNKSWIPLPGGINIQPGEVGKVIFIFTMASHMNLLRGKINSFWSILQLGMHMVITAGAVFAISHDLGVSLMYPLIFLAMMLVSGVSLWWMAAMGVGITAMTPVLWHFMSQAQRLRILVVFDPSVSERYAWQAKQSQLALGNGQLFGTGLLHGTRTQGGWVPEPHTDSIFASCGEELGFVGAAILLLLLGALVFRIYYDAYRASDYFSSQLCVGVGSMFMWQIGINVGMNLGIFPVIGLTLPLVSYGGTSVLTTLTALGLVCGAVARIRPNWIRSADD